MDKTNAERQKRFRERRKAEGLRVKWVRPDRLKKSKTEVFYAKGRDTYPDMRQGEFNGVIKRLLATLDTEEKWVSELILAEVAAYAEIAAAKFKKIARETNVAR
jgi:predicted N-acyltransferase